MIELFKMGGPLFMSILSLELIAVIYVTVKYQMQSEKKSQDLDLVKSIGLFALVTGVFGQMIGLFNAFQYIEASGAVTPAIMASGLKVSMITTLYGALIFLISYGLWFIFRLKK